MKPLRSHRLTGLAKYGFLILGAVFLLGLIRQVGWNQLLAELKLVGWGFILYLFIHALQEGLSAFAWRATFPDAHSCQWWKLYCITWAGSAVNNIYHTGVLGQETTKVALVRKEVSTQDGIASVLIAKLAEAFAQMLFVLSGIFFVLQALDLPQAVETALLLTFALLAMSVLTFWILQRKGLVGSLIRLLEGTPLPSRFIGKLRRQTDVLDESIRTYHLSRLRAFWQAVSLNLARLLLNLAQIQLVLSLLAVPGGFLTCFCIGVFSALVNALFFFIPGRLGAREGGKVLIAQAVGMTTAQGLTLGVVSRLNQIIWSLLGLAVLFLWQAIPHKEASVENGQML